VGHLDDIRAREYAEKKLDAAELQAAAEHVSGCAECQARVAKAAAQHDSADATLEPSAAVPSTDPGGLPHGTKAGRYLILDLLGQGGMGVVYSAYDPDLDRKVALKLLLAEGGDAAEYRARLLREAQAMARLSHPNVVAVHDAGMLDQRLFVAMEMVEGVTLSRWLRTEARPWQQIRDVFLQAGRGLHAAHEKGLVHRDFKPGNVLVSASGRVCVTDFGLARAAESLELTATGAAIAVDAENPPSGPSHLSDSLTRPGVIMGTPAYMAPEQIAGRGIDARSDQYSFCVSLYEALYGARPKPGAAEGLPLPVRDGGPAWLRRAVARGLSHDPADRFPSMDALLQALAVSPYRKAQQAALASGAAAIVVSALGLAWWVSGSAQRRCDATAEREAIWGADAREKVGAAVLGTKKSWAPQAWAGVQKSFDAYALAWASAQSDACLAFELGAKERAVSSPRLDCLAERREELAAMVTLVAASTAETLEKTTSAVQALTPIESCARIELTSTRAADVKTAQARAALRPRLARAKALFEGAQYQQSLGAARDALDMAKAANDPGLTADALYGVAMALDKTGDVQGAAAMLLEAALQADASHRDDTAARAYTWRIFVVGYEQQRPDDAAREERHARAAIARLGGSPELEGNLENALGALYRASNDNEKARAHYTAAIARLEAAYGSDSPRIAGPINNLAISLVGLNRFDEAEGLLKRSMDIRVKAFGEGHPTVGPVLNNMAELAARREQYEKAIELCLRSQELMTTSMGPDHPYITISLNLRGMVLTVMGRYREALEVHELALAKRIKTHGEKHPWVAYDLTGIARAKLGLGDAAGALEPLERAMVLREGAKGQDPRDVAETKLALAKTLAALGKDPERVKQLAAEADEAFTKSGRRVGPTTEAGQWLAAR